MVLKLFNNSAVSHLVKLFADDRKLIATIRITNGLTTLQLDLDALSEQERRQDAGAGEEEGHQTGAPYQELALRRPPCRLRTNFLPRAPGPDV